MPWLKGWANAGHVVLGLMWVSVAAGQSAVMAGSGVAYDMAQIQPMSWAYVVAASLIGGLTKALSDMTSPTFTARGWRLVREWSLGLFMGVVAGLLLFLTIMSTPERFHPSGPLVCILAFIGGYGGKRIVDAYLKRTEREIEERPIPPLGGAS